MLRSLFLIAVVPAAAALFAQNGAVPARPSVVLRNGKASVEIDLGGGAIRGFRLAEGNVNPLSWDSGTGSGPRPMGHFLCLDRWGQPSEAEKNNGMPFHGEASHVEWRANPQTSTSQAEMNAVLPMAGIAVRRKARLLDRAAVLVVEESVTNQNKLGRIYNMVQHPSIAPPFLDTQTLVDANAGEGFMQASPLPDPESRKVAWPNAEKAGSTVDLRRLTNDPDPNVVSFVIPGEYGWVTASSAASGLLLGYIWKTSDYPWLNIWRHTANGQPAARGLEFGTTGLHQPFPVLVKKGKIFGQSLYAYLDAGQTVARSYAAFLVPIPAGYRGVESLRYSGGKIEMTERGSGRVLTVEAGELFSPSGDNGRR